MLKPGRILYYIAYLLVAAIVFPFVRWYADNPDTFQYIDIAKKYLAGDWHYAVNGDWSPLISWLLTVPLLLVSDDLLAFKLFQFLIGLFALEQWIRLLPFTKLPDRWKFYLSLMIIPFLVNYSLLNCTPDLLFLALLVLLLNQLLKGSIFHDTKRVIIIGATGALLYFTKAFGFPLFLALSTFAAIHAMKSAQFSGKSFLTLMAIFLVLSACWIIPLSVHYGKFTLSEAGRYNASAGVAPSGQRLLPVLDDGLHVPPPHATSAWERPSDFVSGETVTLFNNATDYFQVIKRNLRSIYFYDFRNQAGIVLLILLLIAALRSKLKEFLNERWVVLSLVFILILYLGYSLILVHTRYTWINGLLMVLLSASLINRNLPDRFDWAKTLLFFLLLLLAVKRPVKEILFTTDSDISPDWLFKGVRNPFTTMQIMYRPDKALQNSMEELKQHKTLIGNFASLKSGSTERDDFTSALRITRSIGGRYFGRVMQEGYTNQLDELSALQIDYLIAWRNEPWGERMPVYTDLSGIRIYAVKE